MFRNIGTTEIIIVLAVLLVIFGPKKIPELAKGITEALKEFRGLFEGGKKEDNEKKEK